MATGYRSRLGLCLVGLVLLSAVVPAGAQQVIYVDDDHPGDNGPGNPDISNSKEDGTQFSPFDAIQEGLNAADDGDVVVVADGLYNGTGNFNLHFGGKAITLRSASGASNTTIDCDLLGRAFLFDSGETEESVLQGFTIVNGLLAGDDNVGGAIRIDFSSPTIRDCVFTNNGVGGFPGGDGGAIFVNHSQARILNCRFIDNYVGGFFSRGTAMVISSSSPLISDCVVSGGNGSFVGGGILCEVNSEPTIRRTWIQGNDAQFGGGLVLQSGCNANVEQCVIRDNTAGSSPGLYISGSEPIIRDTLIVNNLSSGLGGGIDCSGGSSATITNCTIVGNTKAGISCDSSFPFIENCIIADNGAEGDDLVGCLAQYSLVSDGDNGLGNIRGDAGFRGSDNFRLRPDSRCRNLGDPNTNVEPGSVDLDGAPRVICSRIDMGAYEFGLGDANCDGFLTTGDIGEWTDCATGPAAPDFDSSCSALDYNVDGNVDLVDLAAFMNAYAPGLP